VLPCDTFNNNMQVCSAGNKDASPHHYRSTLIPIMSYVLWKR
jgi:hypothetical protein